jgi:hypothetical protein
MNDAVVVAALIGIGLALVSIKFTALERRLNRLSRVDAKLDALLKHAGIQFDEFTRRLLTRSDSPHADTAVRGTC